MGRIGWFARRRSVLVAASLGGIALASCTSGPGGIVVEPDDSGGAKRDSSVDVREVGGDSTGGAGGSGDSAMTDSAVDTSVADAKDERGTSDGAVPPLCVFHTEPPPATLYDEGGADAMDSGTGTTDAIADTTNGGDGSVADASGQDATTDGTMADAASGSDVVSEGGGGGGDASGDRSGGRDGSADTGSDGPVPSIIILTSPFLGPYLADSTGRTLYTFGNDKPGDCNNPPLPDCEADCAIAWPPFDAGKRTLAAGLDPAVFGSVARADGVSQLTTYYGWPLYFYKSDTTGNVINGQGKSKTWHVATVTPANIMIMRDKTNPRYIADGNGRTLYVFDQDTAGTASDDPVSACTGTCLTQYPPLERNHINAVSSLDPNDLSLFVRPDTRRQQVAYKGAPLYLSTADMRSGDQLGISMGWTVAAAP